MENNPWFVMLLGMGTVFAGLFALILITKLMSLILKGTGTSKSQGAPLEQPAVEGPAEALAERPVQFGDRKLFDAIVGAVIAEYIGGDVTGIRITGVKNISHGDKGGFTAALSAALASAMGEDVSGIRIKSIKKI